MHSEHERMRLGEGDYPGGQVCINRGPVVRNKAANNPFSLGDDTYSGGAIGNKSLKVRPIQNTWKQGMGVAGRG